jgi:hypothetical protein
VASRLAEITEQSANGTARTSCRRPTRAFDASFRAARRGRRSTGSA